MSDVKSFETKIFPTWCPGCGDFGIWTALKMAYSQLGLEPHQIFTVFDIGCSGNEADFINTYAFHALHGRVIPVACGFRAANNKIPTIAIAGDGGAYGEGMGHFIHSIRGNWDLTYIVHDNQVYGLTTGQTTPTSPKGFVSKSTPAGVIEEPINPIALALSGGATFVARGYAGDVTHLTKLIVNSITHKGFSFIDVLQPCVTFNKHNSYQWFREKIYKLDETNHNVTDKNEAFKKSWEINDKIPIGVFYKEEKPTFEDQLPQIKEKTLVEQSLEGIDITPLYSEFV